MWSLSPLEVEGHLVQSAGKAEQTEAIPLCLGDDQQGGRETTP